MLVQAFAARLASGELLPLKGRKTQALVAYLALKAGQSCSREELVGLLWGDRSEQQSLSELPKFKKRPILGHGLRHPYVLQDSKATCKDTYELDCPDYLGSVSASHAAHYPAL